MSAHKPVTAEELAEIEAAEWITQFLPASRPLDLLKRLSRDLAERTAERDALAADVERLIREAGAIRNDERQRAKAEHDGDLDRAHQRAIDRADELERDNARLRRLVDDADRAKAEHEKTRDELRRLHDVLSGKRGAP